MEEVCITEDARDVLQDALYAERNELEGNVKMWQEDGDPEMIREHKDKLKVCEALIAQLNDMEVCYD
jgi:hypothetical protein